MCAIIAAHAMHTCYGQSFRLQPPFFWEKVMWAELLVSHFENVTGNGH